MCCSRLIRGLFKHYLIKPRPSLRRLRRNWVRRSLDVQRDTPLAKEKAIAQSQLDNDIQANLAAKATVQADQALIEQAQLNLEFTNVRSLIDGVAGIATGQVGNLVGPQAILTTVSQLDPIKAYFVVGEQQYLAFVQRNPTVAAREKTERQLVLELVLSDGSTYPEKGKFFAADRQVDVQTVRFVWPDCFRIPKMCYDLVNMAACALSATSGRRRYWYRKKQSRSFRACIKSRWSEATTK